MVTKIEKFGASWCAPCRMIDKALEKIPNTIEVVKYDIDENEDLASEKKIRNIPVLIFYDENNNEINRLVGAVSFDKISEILK